MTKVAHIATIDIGLRYLLLNQLRSIQATGFEIAGISAPGPEVASVEAAGIRHIPVVMTRSPLTPIADLRALWQLYRVLRRERFTIVHTHNPKPGLLGQIAARVARTPVVVNTLHGFYFHDGTPRLTRRLYITLEKIAARCSDVILSQNQEDIQTAVREGICPPEKIKHLGNGIDVQRFDRQRIDPPAAERTRRDVGLPDGAPVVGFVGRLVQEKGLLELFAAARRLRERVADVQFLFVGAVDTHKSDALSAAAAEEYGIADRCHFPGQRQDMPELYSLMDVFVLPSHREGFPRAPMEASAMQVPCVVTDIRGCREAVEQGVNGILVPLGDVDALTEAIATLLIDRGQARRMGEAGRRLALERFDERLVFETVCREYARLLGERGLPIPPGVAALEGQARAPRPQSGAD